MISMLGAFLMGFAELYRGANAGIPRILEKFTLASLALVLVSGGLSIFYHWQFVIVHLILFSAGASVSWGAVVGASLRGETPEKFQENIKLHKDSGDWYLVGWFTKTPLRGLLARSVVWGVLASLAAFIFGYYKIGLVLFLVYSISMPLAVIFLRLVNGSRFDIIVGKVCQKLVSKSHSWPRHELYRGWLVGILLLVIGCLALKNSNNEQPAQRVITRQVATTVTSEVKEKQPEVKEVVKVIYKEKLVSKVVIKHVYVRTTDVKVTCGITSMTPEEAALLE